MSDIERLSQMPLAGAAPYPPEGKPSQSEDLFSAHNFDITINLDIPAPGTGDTLFLWLSTVDITIAIKVLWGTDILEISRVKFKWYIGQVYTQRYVLS